MPSCRSSRSLDKFSSRQRCAMRGKRLTESWRCFIERKSSGTTRNQGSFIIEFRRWLVEFWNTVMKRLKNVFSEPKNSEIPKGLSTKLTSMDSENIFWREGGPTNRRKHISPRSNIDTMHERARMENRETISRLRSPRCSRNSITQQALCKARQVPNSRRKTSGEVTRFTTGETTDDDYFALYKKSNRTASIDKPGVKIFGKSSDDCDVEPIEAILSRYPTRKTSQIFGQGDTESSMETLEIRATEKNSNQRENVLPEVDEISLENSEVERWIENSSFENKWYSRSELNVDNDRGSAIRRKNQVAKVPRHRNSPEKRNVRIYRTRMELRSGNIFP